MSEILTIKVTHKESVDLLKIMLEKKQKHEKLFRKAEARFNKPPFKGNPERLMNRHKAVTIKVENLITKLVQQL